MKKISLEAPIKINLALHVVGQRADGYHLLQTLVAFADSGDKIEVLPAACDEVIIEGAYGGELGADDTNLIVKARDGLRRMVGVPAFPICLRLTKNLPLSSGLGGGSGDAAATLRVLQSVWQSKIDRGKIYDLALQLGADVPMCLYALEHHQTLRVAGIGEAIEAVPDFPALDMVVVNPQRGLSTKDVFRKLDEKNNPPLLFHGTNLRQELQDMRNDLMPPACGLMPEISNIIEQLQQSGAWLVRMSGSGASCFGIYEDEEQAQQAAGKLSTQHPDYFVRAVRSFGA